MAWQGPKGRDVPLGDAQTSASLCPWRGLLGGDGDKLMSQLSQQPGLSAVRGDVGRYLGTLSPCLVQLSQRAVSHPCLWVWTLL